MSDKVTYNIDTYYIPDVQVTAYENKLDEFDELKAANSPEYDENQHKMYLQAYGNYRDDCFGVINDRFFAVKFAEYLHKLFFAFIIFSTMYLYNIKLGVYEAVSEDVLKRFFKMVLDDYNKCIWTLSYEKTYFTAFKRDTQVVKQLLPDPDLLIFTNGMLNIKTMKLTPPTPDVLSTRYIPYDYDPSAQAPTFISTIKEIFNDDEDLIKAFQEAMGYTLSYGGGYPLHKLFILYGSGRNGKGVLTHVIGTMVGEKNMSAVYLDELQGRFGCQNLFDKMVNISPETSTIKQLESSRVKALTGGDSIEVEQKYLTSFTTRIYTKFFVCTNNSLDFNDDSYGLYSRLAVFPFRNTYEESNGEEHSEGSKVANKNLTSILDTEIQGILNWSLEGLLRLKENDWNMTQSESMNKATEAFLSNRNPVKDFLTECIIPYDGCNIRSSIMKSMFDDWIATKTEYSCEKISNTRFKDIFTKLIEKKYPSIKYAKRNHYCYTDVIVNMNGHACIDSFYNPEPIIDDNYEFIAYPLSNLSRSGTSVSSRRQPLTSTKPEASATDKILSSNEDVQEATDCDSNHNDKARITYDGNSCAKTVTISKNGVSQAEVPDRTEPAAASSSENNTATNDDTATHVSPVSESKAVTASPSNNNTARRGYDPRRSRLGKNRNVDDAKKKRADGSNLPENSSRTAESISYNPQKFREMVERNSRLLHSHFKNKTNPADATSDDDKSDE